MAEDGVILEIPSLAQRGNVILPLGTGKKDKAPSIRSRTLFVSGSDTGKLGNWPKDMLKSRPAVLRLFDLQSLFMFKWSLRNSH